MVSNRQFKRPSLNIIDFKRLGGLYPICYFKLGRLNRIAFKRGRMKGHFIQTKKVPKTIPGTFKYR